MKSKVIAISAISSAIIALFLTLGAYVELFDLLSLVLASVMVILPLFFKSYLGSVLCFLVGGVLAFLLSGFNILSIVFPAYFGFMGIYPIVKCKLIEKNIDTAIVKFLGAIWCVACFYGVYYYYIFVMNGIFDGLPELFVKYIIYIVGIVGLIFYFIYDRFILVAKIIADRYLSKIIK